MTENRPQWGVQVTAWRFNRTTVCLDWRTIQTGWLTQPPARGQHRRVLLQWQGECTPANLTLLCQRMTQFVLVSKQWKVTIPKGLPFHEVGGEAASVPPGGGEGGENPDNNPLVTEPLPGIDEHATIDSPPPTVKQESVSEPKARRRSTRSDRKSTVDPAGR